MRDFRFLRHLRHILTAGVFICAVFGAFALNIIVTPPEVSLSERRKLAVMPELSVKTVLDGSFMAKFEDFAADAFFARDGWRGVRALFVYDLYAQTDKDGVYIGRSGMGRFEGIDEASWRQVIAKIDKVAAELAGSGVNAFAGFIPDKSAYAGYSNAPGFRLDTARGLFAELTEARVVDISGDLTGLDFYKTDLHWSQPSIGQALNGLNLAMGNAARRGGYDVKTAGDFRGVYAGQAALPDFLTPTDELAYVYNDEIVAEYLNENTFQWEVGEVYDVEAAKGRDPYDLFLRGVKPLVRLTNDYSAVTDKTLYYFRDSFGSSLGPLLAETYKTVYLIDLRYVDWRIVPQVVAFEDGADALFLYSSQVLNNSTIFLVP